MLDCITLIIPTLNEEKAIGHVIDEAKSAGFTNILVVDGGSTDATVQIAESRGVKVIRQRGHGKGNAIWTALDYVNTPYVAVIDGDYSYSPFELLKLIPYLRNYDLILGERHGPIAFVYRVGNKLLSRIISLLYGVRLKDPLTGLYIVKTEILRSARESAGGFDVEVEIIANVLARGGAIVEIPIRYRNRLGKKKLRPWHAIPILWRALRAAYILNPALSLYILASLFIIPGIALGGWVAYRYFYEGVPHYMLGMAALALVLFGAVSLALIPLAITIIRLRSALLRILSHESIDCVSLSITASSSKAEPESLT